MRTPDNWTLRCQGYTAMRLQALTNTFASDGRCLHSMAACSRWPPTKPQDWMSAVEPNRTIRPALELCFPIQCIKSILATVVVASQVALACGDAASASWNSAGSCGGRRRDRAAAALGGLERGAGAVARAAPPALTSWQRRRPRRRAQVEPAAGRSRSAHRSASICGQQRRARPRG